MPRKPSPPLACQYCGTSNRVTAQHIRNCSRRPHDAELIQMRRLCKMSYKAIGEKIGVSTSAITKWLHATGERAVKPSKKPKLTRVFKKVLLRAYLLQCPGVTFTNAYLISRGYHDSTIYTVIKKMASAGELSRTGRGYLVIGEQQGVELTEHQQRRADAIWPPLETYTGSLWMEAQRERNGKKTQAKEKV